MKRRDCFFILLLLLLPVAGVWFSFPTPRPSASGVSLVLTTNAPGIATNDFTFQLKNSGSREICLSKVIVEVKTSGNWIVVSDVALTKDQFVAPGKSINWTPPTPAGDDPWRLRFAYGSQLEGFRFFMIKMEVTLHSGKFPGAGFGAFAGSNSVSSAEITR